jgi:RNA polymerase sigma-70 factor (ECF subfamily)
LRSGDEKAWAWLYSRYYNQLLKYAYQNISRSEDAEDITQRVFVTAFVKIHAFQPEQKIYTWLVGIARNEIRNARRIKHYRYSKVTTSLDALACLEDDENLHQYVPSYEMQIEIGCSELEGWKELSNTEQQAVELLASGYSIAESAQEMDTTEAAVKQARARGKAKLAKTYQL